MKAPCNQCEFDHAPFDECDRCANECSIDVPFPRFKASIEAQARSKDVNTFESNRECER